MPSGYEPNWTDMALLRQQLTRCLELADSLELAMIGIHIDTALNHFPAVPERDPLPAMTHLG